MGLIKNKLYTFWLISLANDVLSIADARVPPIVDNTIDTSIEKGKSSISGWKKCIIILNKGIPTHNTIITLDL